MRKKNWNSNITRGRMNNKVHIIPETIGCLCLDKFHVKYEEKIQYISIHIVCISPTCDDSFYTMRVVLECVLVL